VSPKQNKISYDLTLSSGDEDTVGNTVASSSQLGPPNACSTDCGSNVAPPMKKKCRRGRRTKATILHTAAGEEVWDISSEEYSYHSHEGQ
jgi:hypothetical protein